MTTFLFSRITHDLLELRERSESSGDTRRAAHSSDDLDPGTGSSHLRGLARPRYQSRRATPGKSACATSNRVSVTIDVHGSLDRAKDVSSFARALIGRPREECGRFAHADDVPLLILPEDTCCRRCVCLPGNEPPTDETDRPRLALFRLPAKVDGCLRIGVPFTVATGPASGSLHRVPVVTRVGPSAHAAHTLPPWLGTMCFGGHCERSRWNYPGENLRRSSTPF